MGGVVIVCAFDPVDELDGQAGVLVLDRELGTRLVAEHRVELVEPHCSESLRYVPGSAAHVSAREQLRQARAQDGQRRSGRKTAKLES